MKARATLAALLAWTAAVANAAPTIDGNTIRWPDDGWYQVQNQVTYESVCEGGRDCTVPDGVYINTLTQRNRSLTMLGVAQSNARVSDYMRNIDASEWFSNPHLDLIKTTESNRRRIANFTLRGVQRPREALTDEATNGDEL